LAKSIELLKLAIQKINRHRGHANKIWHFLGSIADNSAEIFASITDRRACGPQRHAPIKIDQGTYPIETAVGRDQNPAVTPAGEVNPGPSVRRLQPSIWDACFGRAGVQEDAVSVVALSWLTATPFSPVRAAGPIRATE
jgi:hypothetical protein